MKPDIFKLLEGLKLKPNPDAPFQVMVFIILVILFWIISRYIANRPKMIRKRKDEEVYNYIIRLKRLNKEDLELLENMIKRYMIKDKYNLLIMEGKFQKYMEMEIINVEQSSRSAREKEDIVDGYNKLKRKIFDNRK